MKFFDDAEQDHDAGMAYDRHDTHDIGVNITVHDKKHVDMEALSNMLYAVYHGIMEPAEYTPPVSRNSAAVVIHRRKTTMYSTAEGVTNIGSRKADDDTPLYLWTITQMFENEAPIQVSICAKDSYFEEIEKAADSAGMVLADMVSAAAGEICLFARKGAPLFISKGAARGAVFEQDWDMHEVCADAVSVSIAYAGFALPEDDSTAVYVPEEQYADGSWYACVGFCYLVNVLRDGSVVTYGVYSTGAYVEALKSSLLSFGMRPYSNSQRAPYTEDYSRYA